MEHRGCILLQLLCFGGLLSSPFFGGDSAALAGYLLAVVSEVHITVRAGVRVGISHVTLQRGVSKSVLYREG